MDAEAGSNDAGCDPGGRDAAGAAAGATGTGTGPGTGTGTGNPDRSARTRKLAQDWITLWQSEMNAMAADPELRESWQAVIGLWAGTMSSVMRGLPHEHTPSHYDASARNAGAADPPRTPPAAAAPDARDAEIERLARHVAALERRLADIERGSHFPIHSERGP